jgi:lipoate-protein ligase A
MLLIQQKSTNPYFNIATEEYLLKNFSEDIFILYINEPSIIVGKHQNTLSEINHEFVRGKNLKVVRRLSGGGTVYHDFGNLNYSFIANGSEGNLVDFKKFTQPIIDVLQKLGVDAKIGGKNDIRVGDKKVSGNAEHVFKNRVIHHGTLLFTSELDELNESIKVNPVSYTDKSVKSIRSHVANISEYLKDSITINEFANLIVNHVSHTTPNSHSYQFTSDDIKSIDLLIDSKYSTWEWNYGYSPTYSLTRNISEGSFDLEIRVVVEKGLISEIEIESESIEKYRLVGLERILAGCRHENEAILNKLSAVDIDEYLPNLSANVFVKGLF